MDTMRRHARHDDRLYVFQWYIVPQTSAATEQSAQTETALVA